MFFWTKKLLPTHRKTNVKHFFDRPLWAESDHAVATGGKRTLPLLATMSASGPIRSQ